MLLNIWKLKYQYLQSVIYFYCELTIRTLINYEGVLMLSSSSVFFISIIFEFMWDLYGVHEALCRSVKEAVMVICNENYKRNTFEELFM